jgi:GTPase SAR1 family protein
MQNFNLYDQFDQHSVWRKQFVGRLQNLSEWLKQNELLDAGIEERLQRLQGQVASDKVMVAFVAEFSRGKSELINAMFFAGYGRRIMPASAGRTTMCPTELGYEREIPPCLRLLPIETRLQQQSLMDWRMNPGAWVRVDLDVNDPGQLAEAMEKVSEVIDVSKDDARSLGFWNDENPQDNPPIDAMGRVAVPRWRHALINMAHPLLEQGLVILDTPGLNAIGAEPELTVNLIPQANAIVFILAADTGVTKSDLTIWRDHLQVENNSKDTRMVVLNKIDTMWDALSTPEAVANQIERQCQESADILGLARSQVIPISAHKGLLAKVTNDEALLQVSRLPELEEKLTHDILGRRQNVLQASIATSVSELRLEVGRLITVRGRDVAEQKQELEGLRGKNSGVIKQMQLRVKQEQVEFDASGKKIYALRSVHLRTLKELFTLLSNQQLKEDMQDLTQKLEKRGLKFGVKAVYEEFFERVNQKLDHAYKITNEIQTMLAASYRQMNADFGFSLQVSPAPDLAQFETELDDAERNYSQYLTLGNTFRLAEPEYARRLEQALFTRLRGIYESMLSGIEAWNKSISAQLDGQLREKKKHFERRSVALERIQTAASGLEERITEVSDQVDDLAMLEGKLQQLTQYLIEPSVEKPSFGHQLR